jgi:hypothetical protein
VRHTIAFDELRLDHPPSLRVLKKLTDEVSSCKSLDLSVYDLDDEKSRALAELLDKFKGTLVELKCDVDNESDQKEVISFLNDCKTLKRLTRKTGANGIGRST